MGGDRAETAARMLAHQQLGGVRRAGGVRLVAPVWFPARVANTPKRRPRRVDGWRRPRLRTTGGDIAIDLGTANTVIHVRGRGIVLAEPSVVAMDSRTREVHAVGLDAQRMIGRTPASISAERPLRHGVIADFEVTEAMLRHFMQKVLPSRFSHPRVVMCAPSGITDVERRAVEEASRSAGARAVHLIEESLAAAIGSGLPVAEPVGHMVVDIGGGTTEVAVISLGGIVLSTSLRVGGHDLDDAITAHMRSEHRMAIGTRSAEEIKLAVGSAGPCEEDLHTTVRGRDLMSGLPREVALDGDEVRRALEAPVDEILGAVQGTLEQTPPELASDIARHGILLAGGGGLLRGLAERIGEETGMSVVVAGDPLNCVAYGAGAMLEELDALAASSGRSIR